MNAVANPRPPATQDDSLKRMMVMLSAILIPISLSILLTGIFQLIGNYEIVERVPASTEFASIGYPERGKVVGKQFTAKGAIHKLPASKVAYLMVKRDGLYWPKKYLGETSGSWSKEITEPKKKGSKLNVVVLSMDTAGKQQIDQWYSDAKKTGKYPGIESISAAEEIAAVEVKQK